MVGLAVVFGMATVLLASPMVRTVLLIASTLYMFYLAMRVAFAGSKIGFMAAPKKPGIVDGIILQALNPKAYAVNTLFFTGFAFMPESLRTEVILKFIITGAIWIPIHLIWLWAGVALKRMDLAAHIQRRINFAMAGAMLLVVAMAAYSAF